MPMENIQIPISLIAEVLYCPRNFYYRMIEQAQESNEHLLQGKLQEEKRDETPKKYTAEGKKYRKVYLQSEIYSMVGVLDEIEEIESELYPVEYKKGSYKENVHDDVQLCCQAILIEENMERDVQKGYIYYGASSKRREVYFTEELRALTLQTIEEARQIVEDSREYMTVPEPLDDKKCEECSLVSRCMPEEVKQINENISKPSRPLPTVNLGRLLYVDTVGAYLRKKGGTVQVTKDEMVLKEIPMTAIDQVILIGVVNISTQLLHEFLKRNISVHFGNGYGKELGWLNPVHNKNSLLRIQQVKATEDQDKSLALAKAMITGKLQNMRTLLMRYHRSDKKQELEESIEQIQKMIKKIPTAANKNELLGYEGLGSRYYFGTFNVLIKSEDHAFYFKGREKRPPKDPINAMLSYGYSLLTNEVVNELIRVGLDPYIGFLHSNVYGRPALALDLMEEFRSIIVDSTVLTMINKGMIEQDYFDSTLTMCYLNEKGRKALVQSYKTRMNQEIKHPIFEYQLTYRRTIEVQGRLFSKVLTGEIKEYESFKVR